MLRLNFEPGDRLSAVEPAMQLARDEAMLLWADERVSADPTKTDTESFRVWRFEQPVVVLGRSSKIAEEANLVECEQRSIPVLRRCTGGASVVGGPECLMYSVVLRLLDDQSLRKIDVAHDYVMQRVLTAVRKQQPDAQRQGICDLTMDGRKFSGNSLRIARHHLLYHGTVLLEADLDEVAACLQFAPRQPEYRGGREHRDFVTNITLDGERLTNDLAEQFGATEGVHEIHSAISGVADGLLESRYRDPAWHHKR